MARNSSTPSVCIVGAGFSGICAAVQLQKQLGLKTFTLFDSNEDVGGTWLVNKYPGCACDVQSHLYSYSFEKNPEWSSNYSPQPEIWRYIQKVARKYDVYPHIQFNTEVKVLRWDEGLQKWRVTVEDKSRDKSQSQELLFDIVINGSGALRVPNIPEQFKGFKGPLIHSAEWDTSVSLEGKRVAVVGSGASAIQIIPTIAPKVKSLHVYQRKPAWILHKTQYEFPGLIKFLFAYLPFLMTLFRAAIFLVNDLLVKSFYHGSKFSNFAIWQAKTYRDKSLKDDEKLVAELTPSYQFGCKRALLSDEYYPAMARSNVHLHNGTIKTVTSDSVITQDGKEQEVDAIVLATGFQVQDYFAPMEIYGKGGADILDLWRSRGPTTYYGIMANYLPNQFYLLGPNTALGHNSVIFQIECQTNFAMAVIREMMARKAKCVTVKASAEDQFMEQVRKDMKKTVWGNEDCDSWYANDKGEITTLWPKSCSSYWQQTRRVDFNALEFVQ